jgi:hypothetical protein
MIAAGYGDRRGIKTEKSDEKLPQFFGADEPRFLLAG